MVNFWSPSCKHIKNKYAVRSNQYWFTKGKPCLANLNCILLQNAWQCGWWEISEDVRWLDLGNALTFSAVFSYRNLGITDWINGRLETDCNQLKGLVTCNKQCLSNTGAMSYSIIKILVWGDHWILLCCLEELSSVLAFHQILETLLDCSIASSQPKWASSGPSTCPCRSCAVGSCPHW